MRTRWRARPRRRADGPRRRRDAPGRLPEDHRRAQPHARRRGRADRRDADAGLHHRPRLPDSVCQPHRRRADRRPVSALLGTPCRDHLRTADCGTERCATGQCMARGQMVSGETEAHPQDQALDLAYSGVPIKDDTGRVVGALEVATDLTAVKAAARVAKKQVELPGAGGGQARREPRAALAGQPRRRHGGRRRRRRHPAGGRVVRQGQRRARRDGARRAGARPGRRRRCRRRPSRGGSRCAPMPAGTRGTSGQIIQGVNDTLDAVIKPLNEAAGGAREGGPAGPAGAGGGRLRRRPCRHEDLHQHDGHRAAEQHRADHAERPGAGRLGRGARRHQPADGGQRRGDRRRR